ncbi:MAG TPA: MFS transporter, partial [Planctomycetaceae bacterium]|nr:MFS transporter [Planctomycetaceae bacterium]
LAGFLSQYWGRRAVLSLGMTYYALLNVCAAFPWLWETQWFPVTYLLLSPSLIAVSAVGFLSMAMRISWTQALGTVFTTYTALSNVSAVIGKQSVRFLHESLGYEPSFRVAAAMSMLPLLLLPLIRPSQVDDAASFDDAINDLNLTCRELQSIRPTAEDEAAAGEAESIDPAD